jgi:small subunit ribosomal protein S20
MPNHYSALKRMRQTKKRTAVNRTNRGAFRATLRRARKSLEGGASDAVKALVPQTLSSIDKAVQKGLIHKNAAARLKSRLMTRSRAAAKPSAA